MGPLLPRTTGTSFCCHDGGKFGEFAEEAAKEFVFEGIFENFSPAAEAATADAAAATCSTRFSCSLNC